MTDKIGILGQVVDATASRTIANHVAYTVPSGKAAKCQIMWSGKSGADSSGTLAIEVNGVTIAQSVALTTVEFFHSSTAQMFEDNSITAAPSGLSIALTPAMAPQIFYLSAADTVSYTIATTVMNNMQMMVMGTEIDV